MYACSEAESAGSMRKVGGLDGVGEGGERDGTLFQQNKV